MITDLNSIFSSWLYTCNPISAHFKICRNSCVPNEYIKTTLGEISSIRCGECLVCQFFRWPTYFPIFRYQVWGVPGLPTFRWTSFPLFLRCQVRGVPGLPTFCWTSYPYFWGARFGEYLVCQHFVGPHFPSFWGARFSLDLISPILRCQVWGIPGLLTFRWSSYFPMESRQPWSMLDVQWSIIHIYPNKPYLNMGILLFGAHEYALVSRFLSIPGCWYCRFKISIWLDVVLRCSRHVWHH